jgi:hypothetical protein
MPYTAKAVINKPNSPNENDNFLAPNGFRLVIDKTIYADVQYKVQQASIPSISVQSTPAPFGQGTDYEIGDRASFEPLELTFLVDENLKNYKEIMNWIIGALTNKDEELYDGKFKDITLIILSSHNNPVAEIQFIGAFPISLSTLQFDSTVTDVEYLTANVTFQYQYYKLL